METGFRQSLGKISVNVFLILFSLVPSVLLLGCANLARTAGDAQAVSALLSGPEAYRGRLSLKVDALDAQALGPPQGQFFSAAFELTGNAQNGELTLMSPLGSVLATLSWTPVIATMNTGDTVRRFESLDALTQHATGAAIPVASLFSWLAGKEIPTAGWQADLSGFSGGRLVARRTSPLPNAELRLVLER